MRYLGTGRHTRRHYAGPAWAGALACATAVLVEVQTLRGRGSGDPERPYRRATVLHDRRVDCDDRERLDASCGAAIEVYASTAAAIDRVRAKRGEGRALRRDVYVLRVSPELDLDDVRRYRQAFRDVVGSR